MRLQHQKDNNGLHKNLQRILKKINFAFLKKSNSEEAVNSLEHRFHSGVWSEVALEISIGVLLSRKARFNPYRRSNSVEKPFGIALLKKECNVLKKGFPKQGIRKVGTGLPVIHAHAAGIDIGDTFHWIAIPDGPAGLLNSSRLPRITRIFTNFLCFFLISQNYIFIFQKIICENSCNSWRTK